MHLDRLIYFLFLYQVEELRLEIAGLVQEYADLKYVEKVFIPSRSVFALWGAIS